MTFLLQPKSLQNQSLRSLLTSHHNLYRLAVAMLQLKLHTV